MNLSELTWHVSSKCEAQHCIQVAWTTSSRCSTAQGCVEVGHEGDRVLVRDGKLGDESPVIEYTRDEWIGVLSAVGENGWVYDVWIIGDHPDDIIWSGPGMQADLSFDRAEINAFVAGVRAGEFVPEQRCPNCAPGYDCERGVYVPESSHVG